jgi:hypothetical protein
MASAASLNATATIVNGHGLSANPNLITAIATYRNHTPITLLSNVYVNAQTDSNVANIIIPVLNTIGNTATQGHFLLDIYPPNITPACSTSVVYYGNSLASTSQTIQNQANYPFSNGLAGFALGFRLAYGTASQAVDTIGSLSMLNGKTYAQSGVGYTGITDLLTGGIGSEANLLGTIVSGWGTMYNVTNINLISDPYVFGQNLLNQGLGSYGGLSDKLAATGLDVTDITQAPVTGTVTYPTASTVAYSSFVGEITLPTVANTTVTTTATGNNPTVVINIYSTITGNDLKSIVSATGFSGSLDQITSLADFLNFNKIVDSATRNKLAQFGVTSFSEFSKYLNSRIGQQQFIDWTGVSKFLASIKVPALSHITTTANTPVLNPGTASTLSAAVGVGNGPFGNPVMSDYLGAVAGIPYNTAYTTINSNYALFAGPIVTAMTALDKSITDTYTVYYASAVNDGMGNITYTLPDPGMISSNVAKVTAAMNALTANTTLGDCQRAYYKMLNSITAEVNNLSAASIAFTNGGTSALLGFGQAIGGYGKPDSLGLGVDQIIGNLITNDFYGDTIRAVIAESINGQATVDNDPNPIMALNQSSRQNIPLTTYLSQNK